MSSRGRTSTRLEHLSESWIREMTRVALECGAVNLSQGYPDFDPPPEVREAAAKAVLEGPNQYAVTWGLAELREARCTAKRESPQTTSASVNSRSSQSRSCCSASARACCRAA